MTRYIYLFMKFPKEFICPTHLGIAEGFAGQIGASVFDKIFGADLDHFDTFFP